MLEVFNYLLVGGAMGYMGNIMGISWKYHGNIYWLVVQFHHLEK